VFGVDIHRVGGTGRLWASNNFGGRSEGSGGEFESGKIGSLGDGAPAAAPEGMSGCPLSDTFCTISNPHCLWGKLEFVMNDVFVVVVVRERL